MKSYFWVKVRHTWLDDDVIGTLPSDALKWRYLQLYLAAGDLNQGGALPPLPRLAYRLRLSVGDLEADLATLQGAGLLRQDGDVWQVVRFADEQGRASDAERAELYRERQRKQAAGMQADADEETDLDEDEEKEKEKSSSRPRLREMNDTVTSCDDDHHDHHDDDHDDASLSALFLAYKNTRPPDTELSVHDRQVLRELAGQHGQDAVIAAIRSCAMSATEGRFNLAYLVARLENPLPNRGSGQGGGIVGVPRDFEDGDRTTETQQETRTALRQIEPGVWTGPVSSSERAPKRKAIPGLVGKLSRYDSGDAPPPPKVLEGGAVMMPTATRHKENE